MVRYICIAAGAWIAAQGAVYLIRLIVLRLYGIRTTAEVIGAKEPKQGSYVHTLRFEHNGKMVEKDDKTGYSQPIDIGSEVTIICNRKDAGKFEYASALKKNMIISLVLIGISILLILRFSLFVTES